MYVISIHDIHSRTDNENAMSASRAAFLKALGHDISKRFVTIIKRIVHGPSFR